MIFHVTFGKQVKDLVEVMEKMGNPFLEDTTDLLSLDIRDIRNQISWDA